MKNSKVFCVREIFWKFKIEIRAGIRLKDEIKWEMSNTKNKLKKFETKSIIEIP